MHIEEYEQRGVKIYRLCVDELSGTECFWEYYEQMSERRRSKVDRQQTDGGKKLTLGAGILMDAGLMKYGLRERSVRVQEWGNGKPYAADYPQIHFNLSHSKNMVIAVFADTEVGCDIEYIGSLRLQIAKRYFCPAEYEYIISRPKEKQRETFYRLWTLKESFMKATGMGMKLPLNQFEFLLGEEEVRVRQSVDDAKYHFMEFAPDGYRMAVCTRKQAVFD